MCHGSGRCDWGGVGEAGEDGGEAEEMVAVTVGYVDVGETFVGVSRFDPVC